MRRAREKIMPIADLLSCTLNLICEKKVKSFAAKPKQDHHQYDYIYILYISKLYTPLAN